jgi:ferredoxin
MRVEVDSDRCIGSGQCVVLAPEVFDQDEDDGTVVVLVEEIAPDHDGDVREAAASCPARVIRING